MTALELHARNLRPDLLAEADDLAEAELIRTGQLSFEAGDAFASSAREEWRAAA